MEAHLSQKDAENPYQENDGAQDLHDDNLGGEKEAMEIKRLFGSKGSEIET